MSPSRSLLRGAIRLLALAVLFTQFASVVRAHDEPPKTAAELADARELQRRMAAAGVTIRRLYETRTGEPETLLLTDSYDPQGRHIGQVVHDPARAERSRSSWDAAGDWTLEETWRQERLAERVTFVYDTRHLLVEAVSEDLATGTREHLAYDHAADPDGIVVRKMRADTLVYSIRYLYEPGGERARLLTAEQTDSRGETLLTTRQTWEGGRRRGKEVVDGDGALAYSFVYEHDAAGDLRSVARRDHSGAVVLLQVHEYGPDRLPLTVTDHDAEGRVTRILRYEYDRRRASPR